MIALAVFAALAVFGGAPQKRESVPPYLQLVRALDDPNKLRRVLLKGIDPNITGKYMPTPALMGGYQVLESSRLLLVAGANPNIRDERGFTPLIELCDLYANPTMGGGFPTETQVRRYSALLILAGADPDMKAKNGHTAITILAKVPKLQAYLIHLRELQRESGIRNQQDR
ncbi:MAG: hypothetical protein ACHQ50_00095 [Fimbriimonadales bacterium]